MKEFDVIVAITGFIIFNTVFAMSHCWSNMRDGKNLFIWLLFMFFIFVLLFVLETALEVPEI